MAARRKSKWFWRSEVRFLLRDFAGPESLHLDAFGMRPGNRIAQLHLTLIGQFRRHQVLGCVSCGVGAHPVYTKRVFSAESGPTVPGVVAVSIYGGFSPGKARVNRWAPKVKNALRVYKYLGAAVGPDRLVPEHMLDDSFSNIGPQLVQRRLCGVFLAGRDGNAVNAGGLSVPVFDSDVGFGFRTKVGQEFFLLPPPPSVSTVYGQAKWAGASAQRSGGMRTRTW